MGKRQTQVGCDLQTELDVKWHRDLSRITFCVGNST